eukprot:scaffold46938_cov75-Phaeocystis_antarctica.AAC.2
MKRNSVFVFASAIGACGLPVERISASEISLSESVFTAVMLGSISTTLAAEVSRAVGILWLSFALVLAARAYAAVSRGASSRSGTARLLASC